MKLSQELQQRGFIHQFSAETLEEIVDGPKRTIYHGVEPTADSIHAGNFVQFMLLKHLADAGHNIIVLVGGGTGMIGDPKPDVERPLTPPKVVAERSKKLKKQFQKILGGTKVTFVNNHDWLGKLNLIDFLRETGKHFTVNELIKKDAISKRLNSETGLSYTEFAYPLLQGFDYLQLHKKYKCDVQTGGSDQWGNIVAGVELVRKKEQETVFAITTPLIIDKATGKKFGKSEGNAVWLDEKQTSPFAFYQFWLNASDESVVDYLKLFTLLSLEEIADIEKVFLANPSTRSAQKHLAKTVTAFVHGEQAASSAAKVTEILFSGGDASTLSASEKKVLLENAPVYEVVKKQTIVDVLVETQLASSKREARTFVESGAVTLGQKKVTDVDGMIEIQLGDITPLRRGKKKFVVLYKK